MATRNSTGRQPASQQPPIEPTESAVSPATRNGLPFFELSAKYSIAQGATLGDLFDDCACLWGVGLEAVAVQHEEFSNAQWAGLYALRQAKCIFDEFGRRATFVAGRNEVADAGGDAPAQSRVDASPQALDQALHDAMSALAQCEALFTGITHMLNTGEGEPISLSMMGETLADAAHAKADRAGIDAANATEVEHG